MNSDINDEIERLKHNEKVRKNIEKFHKTGKLLDDNGNELKIGDTVNYEIVKK
jgi:uncharacterized protein YicC (UPF0701 family)